MSHVFAHRRVLLILFAAALLFQTAATVAAIVFLDLPVSTEADSVEYIRTADNVLAGHGFSIETAPPFRPNGFRTPGPLVLNIPIRVLSLKHDLAAALLTRLLLFVAALLCVLNADQWGVHKYALLAGPLFVLTPTMFYYSMLAYSTELPYSLVFGLFALTTSLYLNNGKNPSALMIALSALYALYLRPAALFVLLAYLGACALVAVTTGPKLRRRLLIAALACFLGTGTAYGTWCCRNHFVFNAFEHSTVAGENLLQFGARAMEPFLNLQGKQELNESLRRNPIVLRRYNGPDQFVISDRERKEGLRLILKYPMAFLLSHMRGTLESMFIFHPAALKSRSKLLVLTLSTMHFGYLLLGTFGLVLLFRTQNVAQRTSMLITACAGCMSSLSGGALYSPRFRIPLDIMFVVGIAHWVAWMRRQDRAVEPPAYGSG